ncbi:MAG: hypothetical protein J2P15_17775 [Micromonosporaceae bacterium]|nr:hypothetical protein [Micromonosporaceae bacterium]
MRHVPSASTVTSSTASPEEETEPPSAAPATRIRWTGRRPDLITAAVYVLLAVWVTGRLWREPTYRAVGYNPGDQTFFEWMLAHGAQIITHGQSPFFTHAMNFPTGVNLMANTSILGLSIPLAPVTLLFGPGVSYVFLVTASMALTGFGWYFVFSRHVVTSRLAAALGGGVCGFAPMMVSHTSGQPNLVAQFALPFIALATLKLAAAPIRAGIALGLLIVYQALVNEELLFIAALALGLFVVVYALFDLRRRWRASGRQPALAGLRRDALRYLTGLGLAALIAIVVLAYPLYHQFAGPQSYHGLPFPVGLHSNDVLGLVTPPRQSLVGLFTKASTTLTKSPNEDDAEFGWPLVILGGITMIWLWRRSILVRTASVVGIVFAILSLGPVLRWRGHPSTFSAPYQLLNGLPPFDLLVPGRLALATTPVLGALLALGLQAAFEVPHRVRVTRVAACALAAVALLAIFPTPIPVTGRHHLPDFLASGAWRRYVGPGQSIVFVPMPASQVPDGMYWQAQTGLKFSIARGYFLGPRGPNDKLAQFGAPARPTSSDLYRLMMLPYRPTAKYEVDGGLDQFTLPGNKGVPLGPITAGVRAAARADLRYWRAPIMVLAPPQRSQVALRAWVTELVGFPPQWIDGVWLWDVRQWAGLSGPRPG